MAKKFVPLYGKKGVAEGINKKKEAIKKMSDKKKKK